jgi:hypothetical protein
MSALRWGWLLALSLAAGAAWAEAPHAHGVAKLDIALEGRRLTLAFTAPLEDIVGFERRPANDKERAALEAAVGYFKSGRAFVASAAANCRLADAGTVLDVRGEGHYELEARLAYDCKEPLHLREIDAVLFGQYKKIKRIDVRAVTPKGQSAGRLGPAKRAFAL